MKTRATTASELARELEAQLDEYADERGQILTEAAEYWHRAGEDQRAIELLSEAITMAGEDGGNARVAYADILFDLDRVDEVGPSSLRFDRTDHRLPHRTYWRPSCWRNASSTRKH
ncbi:MAG: hypothetical protein ABJA86_03905 [Nocardioidaceae bacterium]